MAQPKILLVDDDPDFLEVVSALIEKEYEVRKATSGREALALIAQSPPDLVVLDVMMTHISEGFDVARKIKSDPQTRDIPILMLTSVDEIYDIRSQIDESWRGCDRYLAKPAEPRELLANIRELLECRARQSRAC